MKAAAEPPDSEELDAPLPGLLARLKAMPGASLVALRHIPQRIAARLQRAPVEDDKETAETGKASRAEESEALEEEGLPARLKAQLRASILATLRLKQHLLARFQRAPAELEEESVVARTTTRSEVNEAAKEDATAPRIPRRTLLIYTLVLVVGVAAGGGGGAYYAYHYLSDQLSKQKAEVVRQRDELATQAKSVTIAKQKFVAQQAKRIDAEKRLALMQADRENPLASPGGPENQGSAHGAAESRTGNCQLHSGNVGASLKDCIADFNRK